MDFSIQNILKQVQETSDKYIIEVLKKYNLITNSFDIYDYFKLEYPEINISYCGFLDDSENKIYLNKNNSIVPIIEVYEEPRFKEDMMNMTYRCYSNIHLEAGGVIL